MIAIREADRSDIPDLVRQINTAFQVERFFVDGDRTSLEHVGELMHKGTFLIAELEGRSAGCVYAEIRGDRVYFGLLAVSPDRQKSGLGRRLVEAVEHFGAERGCREVELTIVNLRTELPGFYAKLGFRETGVAPFQANVVSKLPCHFVKMAKSIDRPGS